MAPCKSFNGTLIVIIVSVLVSNGWTGEVVLEDTDDVGLGVTTDSSTVLLAIALAFALPLIISESLPK